MNAKIKLIFFNLIKNLMHAQLIRALMEEHVNFVQSLLQVTNVHVCLNTQESAAKLVN